MTRDFLPRKELRNSRELRSGKAMAGSIVTTTALAASAAFTVGWIVARRKFVGRALVAEEKYSQLFESCRRQVATTRTQIRALNDRIAVLNKHAWWGPRNEDASPGS
jgi:hypothetical protein